VSTPGVIVRTPAAATKARSGRRTALSMRAIIVRSSTMVNLSGAGIIAVRSNHWAEAVGLTDRWHAELLADDLVRGLRADPDYPMPDLTAKPLASPLVSESSDPIASLRQPG
jgi:hypothetical protein